MEPSTSSIWLGESGPRQPSDSVASMITLRPGAEVESAIGTLRDLAREVTNLTNAQSPYERLDDWRAWTSQAFRRARAILPERELQRVVLGPRLESLFSTDQTTRSARTVAAAIDTELQVRIEELNDAAKELEGEWERWHRGQATAIVLDTNVLMQFGPRLGLVNWHDRVAGHGYRTPVVVLVPIQVVEELDVQKDRGADNSKRAAARAVLRWLDDSFPLGTPAVRLRGDGTPRDEGAWLRVWWMTTTGCHCRDPMRTSSTACSDSKASYDARCCSRRTAACSCAHGHSASTPGTWGRRLCLRSHPPTREPTSPTESTMVHLIDGAHPR